eukprot:167574-Amphidinium_carterae.1
MEGTRQHRFARARLGRLEHLRVQKRALGIYTEAVQRFRRCLCLYGLCAASSVEVLDRQLCEYLEDLWASGNGRAEAGNILPAVQNFIQKKTCAWTLWSAWRK